MLYGPRSQTKKKEMESILKPATVKDKYTNYLTKEDVNRIEITDEPEEEDDEHEHEDATDKEPHK